MSLKQSQCRYLAVTCKKIWENCDLVHTDQVAHYLGDFWAKPLRTCTYWTKRRNKIRFFNILGAWTEVSITFGELSSKRPRFRVYVQKSLLCNIQSRQQVRQIISTAVSLKSFYLEIFSGIFLKNFMWNTALKCSLHVLRLALYQLEIIKLLACAIFKGLFHWCHVTLSKLFERIQHIENLTKFKSIRKNLTAIIPWMCQRDNSLHLKVPVREGSGAKFSKMKILMDR